MRFFSNSKSSAAGEPSVLAIAETLAAMTASVWIGVHFNTWMHVAVGACIAPLLLLRTDESCIYGIKRVHRGFYWLEKKSGFRWGLVYFLIVFPLLPAIALTIRIWATMKHFATDPIGCLHAIPINWWRIAVATDSCTSPEWLPLPTSEIDSSIGFTPGFARIYTVAKWFLEERPWKEEAGWPLMGTMLIFICIGIPVLVLLALTAFAYRWSIKATAIVWAPMLWALKPAKPADRDWYKHLQIEFDLKKPQVVAVWSSAWILIFAGWYGMWAAKYEVTVSAQAWRTALSAWSPRIAASPLADAVIRFFGPGQFRWWHLAFLINSLLGVFMWWKYRDWLAHFKHDVPPPDKTINKTLGVVFFLRHLLTSYVILCEGYIAIEAARKLPVPDIGGSLFPWG